MKKRVLKVIYCLILNFVWTGLALAQGVLRLENPLGSTITFGEVISKIAEAIVKIGIPLAGLFIIFSGFLFISARGNEEQLSRAKHTFFWTIVGTLVIVSAWAIAQALDSFYRSVSS